jgi:hypothetical protein
MEVKELKNYGKGFVGIMTDPEYMKQGDKIMSGEFRKQLGLWNMLMIIVPLNREKKRMKKHDWSNLTRRGVPQEFIDNVIGMIATMKVLADRIGLEKASQVFRRAWDNKAYEMSKEDFPSASELKMCGDAFSSFKEWMKAFEGADVEKGVFETKTLEDTSDVYSWSEQYCAFQEIAKEFGNPYFAYPSLCYWEEAFFPKLGKEAGFRFQRPGNGTLATGAPACSNKIERVTK